MRPAPSPSTAARADHRRQPEPRVAGSSVPAATRSTSAERDTSLGVIAGSGGVAKRAAARSRSRAPTPIPAAPRSAPARSASPGAAGGRHGHAHPHGGSFFIGGTTISGGLSGTGGGLVLNGGSLTANSIGNNTFGGVIPAPAPVKKGTGTLMLSGTNTYTGGTTVSGGILAGHDVEPAGQHPQQRHGDVQPGEHRHLCRRDVGHRRHDPAGRRHLSITGNNTYTGATTVNGSALVVNGSLTSNVTLDATARWAARGRSADCVQWRHDRAGQLDRHADRQRQLHPDRRHLPGRGQCAGPERPRERRRHGHHQRRHGAGAGCPRQLRHQHDLHHPQRHGRRDRHLHRCHEQLRLPDAIALLRRQQRVPDAGAAGQRLLGLRRQHAEPAQRSARRWTSPSPLPPATSPR